MKIIDIISAKDLLDKISQNNNLPTRTAYQLYNLILILNDSLGFYEAKRRSLFEELGQTEGDEIFIPKDRVSEFNEKISKTLNLDVENSPERVKVSLDVDLGISPADIGRLTSFIEFVD